MPTSDNAYNDDSNKVTKTDVQGLDFRNVTQMVKFAVENQVNTRARSKWCRTHE